MSGECQVCFEHTLDCICKTGGSMNASNKWLEDEMRELRHEKKRQQKRQIKDCKHILAILFLFIFLFFFDALSADSYIRYDGKEEQINLAYDSRRIYYISGMKNIDLLKFKINEKVKNFEVKKVLFKCIQHHYLKFDYKSHVNGLIAAIFADDFLSVYALKVDIDDDYELFDKIFNTMIYCFRIDDEREKRPTHTYVDSEIVDWSYFNMEAEENP